MFGFEWMNKDVVGVIVVENHDIAISSSGWEQESMVSVANIYMCAYQRLAMSTCVGMPGICGR